LRVNEAQVTNGGEPDITGVMPYHASITIEGLCPLLFHAWNVEAVSEKASAAKGSTGKKTDNIESYVYRDPNGRLCIPTVNFVASLVAAGRWRQDPRSPRKCMIDLLKASLVPASEYGLFEPNTNDWDYLDKRRVTVQRAGITRVRPAMNTGWRVRFDLMVTAAEYVPRDVLLQIIAHAGQFVGLCDFRPTYGRFACVELKAE